MSYQRIGSWLCLGTAALLIMLLAGHVGATQKGISKHRIMKSEDSTTLVGPPPDIVTIEKKTIGSIITTTGKSYAVSEATMIIHTDGNQVSIRRMLVPCEAEVTYAIEKGIRTARRIEIKRVGNNPTWKWTSPQPE